MINVRLYKEIIVPIFAIKHGQFAVVALTRSRANKLQSKVWESCINKRDRIVLREHQKLLILKGNLILNFQLHNNLQVNTLTIEWIKIWLAWMLKSKASSKTLSKARQSTLKAFVTLLILFLLRLKETDRQKQLIFTVPIMATKDKTLDQTSYQK